jgi:hypothetical protein
MGIGGGSCMMIMIHIRFCIIDFLTLPSRVSRTSDCCSPVSEARTMDSLACMHHAQVSADFMTVRSGCSGNGAPGPRLSLSLRFDNEKRSGHWADLAMHQQHKHMWLMWIGSPAEG